MEDESLFLTVQDENTDEAEALRNVVALLLSKNPEDFSHRPSPTEPDRDRIIKGPIQSLLNDVIDTLIQENGEISKDVWAILRKESGKHVPMNQMAMQSLP